MRKNLTSIKRIQAGIADDAYEAVPTDVSDLLESRTYGLRKSVHSMVEYGPR
jgi:hypothetical protein